MSNLHGCINLVLEYENQHKTSHTNIRSNTYTYTCDECNMSFTQAHQYYIHCYKKHEVPIPKLDSELGIIEEIDDLLLAKYQEEDSSLKYIFDSDLGADLSNITNSRERKDLINHEYYLNENGVLYTADSTSTGETCLRIVLPKQLRKKLISEVHDGVMSAHPGIAHKCKRISDCIC